MHTTVIIDAIDAHATEIAGGRLSKVIDCGLINLYGELGAGKTTFVRGFLHAKGWRGKVKSPTFTLLEPYVWDGCAVYHMDLYRLGDPSELDYLGVRDLFSPGAIMLVEWPQRGGGYLPQARVDVILHYQGEGRRIELRFIEKKAAELFEHDVDQDDRE